MRDAPAVSERAPLRRGQLVKIEPGSDMVTGSENEKSILLLWLNLLGWQVHVEQAGPHLVGVARHCSAEGSSFRVDATAPTQEELALKLFEAALKIVETRGRRVRRPLIAA
jgi:hypothetical protein